MAWIGRVIMAVGTMALGFVAISVVAAALIAPQRPGTPSRTESILSAERTGRVTLRAPAEGEATARLALIDESGRPLAVLTRWRSGASSIAASRDGGIDVGCYFNDDGTARCSLFIASRRTQVSINPEGVVTTAKRISPPPGPAPGPRPSCCAGVGPGMGD